MFRDDNIVYYRPDNGKLNHAVSVKRPQKKKDLMNDLREQLAIAKHYKARLEHQVDDDTCKKLRQTDEQIRKLQHALAELESSTVVHKVRHTTKKRKKDYVFNYCKKVLQQSIANNIGFTTAEDVARQINAPVDSVRQVFSDMNKRGWLSQAVHHVPHDCFRPDCSGWQADIYYIQPKAKTELS